MASDPTIDALAAQLHALYQREARRRGDTRHPYGYADLPAHSKDYDLTVARWIVKHTPEINVAAMLADPLDAQEEGCRPMSDSGLPLTTPLGTTIYVSSASALRGTPYDHRLIARYLVIGHPYTLARRDIHDWNSEVWLAEVDAKVRFNGLNFCVWTMG